MIIFQIKLPPEQDAEAFAAFMQDAYFPAVHKGPTRVGQVTSLALLAGETPGQFFWHVGWGGLSSGRPVVDDDEVLRRFKSFHPRLRRIGVFREVATWHASND